MKITILGCGSSGGVPLIGNNWGACNPANPRNRRTRVSILVEQGDTTLLIDTTPDLRQQMLAANIKKIDAVLYTHAHADHCHGIDELRDFMWLMKKPVDIYADPFTLGELTHRFAYAFNGAASYQPIAKAHTISGSFSIGDIPIIPFTQNHGNINTLGYRFGTFAYSTDVHSFDADAWATLQGIKTWVVDCVRPEPHPTHSHTAQTLDWIARLKPDRAYLTHMNHLMDYDSLVATLPPGVAPAYDGLVIEC